MCFRDGFPGACLDGVRDMRGLPQGASYALAGIAGWIGPNALDALGAIITSKTGVTLAGQSQADDHKSEE